jgi:uncharacterized protein
MTDFDRREFLRRSAAASLGLSLLPLAARAAEPGPPPRVRRTVRLGRTGLQVPDIGFGSSGLDGDEELVRYALDRGITYFDTAESYTGGTSETTLGRALGGARERVTLATKVGSGATATRDEMMRALEGSLRRLRTDRVEIYFLHAVNDVARIANPEWPEFLSRAKQQGKVRWSGLSGHGGRLAECVDHALDHDLADVLLLAHNFGQDPGFLQQFTGSFDFVAIQPEMPRLMAKAKAKDVGVVAMKTLRGARLNDMRKHEEAGATFAQAAFRWVLAGPSVDSLVVTMRSTQMVDEYLAASGSGPPTRADLALLARYESAQGRVQCRYGCSSCESACPAGVPIADVMRTRMYAEDYEDDRLAREEYATLGAAAAPARPAPTSAASAPARTGCRFRSSPSAPIAGSRAAEHGLPGPAASARRARAASNASEASPIGSWGPAPGPAHAGRRRAPARPGRLLPEAPPACRPGPRRGGSGPA